MVTLMVGVLLVAVSAVGFGFALFGRRPVPQPAMSLTGAHLGAAGAEPLPSSTDFDELGDDADDPWPEPDTAGVRQVGTLRRLLQREPTADHPPAADVTLSPWVRARSAMYLALIVAGLAAVIGIVTSIVLVGLVLVLT
jgi:hypothetical protein